MKFGEAIEVLNAKKSFFHEARTPGARAEKDIYYHGTGTKLYSTIRKQGLIPDPKQRTWDKDEDRSHHTYDRSSYGGIYVTRNLMTAMSSAGRHARRNGASEPGIIVIMELQPRALFLDEDELVFGLGNAGLKGTSDAEQIRFWLYLEWKYGDDADGYVRKSKQEYEEKLLQWAEKHMLSVDEGLKTRLKQLAPKLWEASVTRTTAYYPKVHGQYWKSSWKTELQRYASKEYDWDDPNFPMPPNESEAEALFRKEFEQLTRTLKQAARPSQNEKSFSHNARLTTPIGYSGQNRIIAIIQELPNFKYKLLYGKLPEDFRKQWKERVGSDPDVAMVKDTP